MLVLRGLITQLRHWFSATSIPLPHTEPIEVDLFGPFFCVHNACGVGKSPLVEVDNGS